MLSSLSPFFMVIVQFPPPPPLLLLTMSSKWKEKKSGETNNPQKEATNAAVRNRSSVSLIRSRQPRKAFCIACIVKTVTEQTTCETPSTYSIDDTWREEEGDRGLMLTLRTQLREASSGKGARGAMRP